MQSNSREIETMAYGWKKRHPRHPETAMGNQVTVDGKRAKGGQYREARLPKEHGAERKDQVGTD